MQLEPIGIFSCQEKRKYEAARQGVYAENRGQVQLHPGKNFEQALVGLEGFRRIWLVFGFDQNQHWKPMVQPQNLDYKVGVFATRAPYRPNQIGMSCVELDFIDGLTLNVSGHDLLDQTSIFDIKPYHIEADAFSTEQVLREDCWYGRAQMYKILWSPTALEHARRLEKNKVNALRAFVSAQLSFQPFDQKRKRVFSLSEGIWQLAYKTWRITYRELSAGILQVESVTSVFQQDFKGQSL